MSHDYELLKSAATGDRLVALAGAAVQLSDGTLAQIVHDGSSATTAAKLYHSADGIAHTLIATLTADSGTGNFISTRFSLVRDASDNLYVVGNGNVDGDLRPAAKAFVKGSGYTWTAQVLVGSSVGGAGTSIPTSATWCNTGGGTSNKGHLLLCQASPFVSTYAIFDAGKVLAGTANPATATGSSPAFMGSGGNPAVIVEPSDISNDGFGATTGLYARIAHSPGNVTVGRWGVSVAGTLSVNTALTGMTTTGGLASKVRVVRYDSDRWAVFAPGTGNKIDAARYSSAAQLTAQATWGTVTNMPTPGAASSWDVIKDPVTANRIWLLSWSTAAATTLQRLEVDLGTGIAWGSAVTVVTTAVGIAPTSLRTVKEPLVSSAPWQAFDNAGGSNYRLVGGTVQFNRAPSANLTTPSNASVLDLAAGATFAAAFSDLDTGDTPSAAYFRRKLNGAASYEYFNAGTGAFQSTEVKRSGASEEWAFGPGLWSNSASYNWSVAYEDALGVKGPYAADFTVSGSSLPSVIVTGPTGTITDTSRPTVEWSVTDPDGDPQERYHAKVFSQAEYEAVGFDPATSTPTWDSTETSSADARSRQPDVDLNSPVTHRAYVRVRTNSQWSGWEYSGFTVSLTPPDPPTVAVTEDPANGRNIVVVTGHHTAVDFPDATYRVEYSDDEDTWAVLRHADALEPDVSLVATAYDTEAPLYRTRSYRAITEATA